MLTFSLLAAMLILADYLMIVMSVVMVGMSYQIPVSVGVIQGGGDTKFQMYMNLISTWVNCNAFVFPDSVCMEADLKKIPFTAVSCCERNFAF